MFYGDFTSKPLELLIILPVHRVRVLASLPKMIHYRSARVRTVRTNPTFLIPITDSRVSFSLLNGSGLYNILSKYSGAKWSTSILSIYQLVVVFRLAGVSWRWSSCVLNGTIFISNVYPAPTEQKLIGEPNFDRIQSE